MTVNPRTDEAYQLFHNGILALAKAESQGIHVDVEYIQNKKQHLTRKIERLEKKFKETSFYKKWSDSQEGNVNIYSPTQLANYLYKTKHIRILKETASGQGSTDEETLKQLNIPELNILLEIRKLKKVRDTYLDSYLREQVNGVIHPFYNLHLVKSQRSSSDSPNLQNVPKRDEETMQMVRGALYPRQNHQLLEIDFHQLEVCISACYNKDSRLIKYIKDKADMHADMSEQIFKIDKYDPNKHKVLRNATKNGFVFPEFYGDYFVNCAENMACGWGKLGKGRWKAGEGIEFDNMFLSDHLISKGITSLKQFEKHIEKIEDDFWNNRFEEYSRWKERWWNTYRKYGYFDSLTGFRCSGVMTKNEVINLPVQGCLQKDSKVLTEHGWIEIQYLINKKIKIWTGFNWADAIGLDRGESTLAEIELNSGLTIKCDVRHKLKNENDEWISFNNLKVGDFVALPKTNIIFEASSKINWAFVFGFIIGDGCLHTRRDMLSIIVGRIKKDILKKIYQFLLNEGYNEETYGGVHWRVIPAKGNKDEKYCLFIENKDFAKFLKANGFDYKWKSHTKCIPFCVWSMSIQNQRDFMEGLWLSDGARGIWQGKTLHMCNISLLKEVQILTSFLGFDSILTGNILRFHYNKFNAKSPRKYPKNAILKRIKNINRNNYKSINEFITDKRNFNLLKKRNFCFQYTAERMILKNSVYSEIYRYDQIKTIKILDKIEHTFTMSVNHPLHQFVADGVIHKNSAFHCLLWSFIEMTNFIEKNKLESRLIGQIHDSMLFDILPDELPLILKKVYEITTIDLLKAWNWIIVPLAIEAELAPVNASWAEKNKIDIFS